MEALATTGIALLYVALLAGMLMIPLGLPGTWLMAIAAWAFAFFGDLNPGGSEMTACLIVGALVLCGELIELAVRILGSKMAKVPTGAIVAAIVGGLFGAIIGVPVFLIGSLIGLLIGVFLGAFIYALFIERRVSAAIWMAVATTTSQVVALFAKTCVGLAIIIYLTIILF